MSGAELLPDVQEGSAMTRGDSTGRGVLPLDADACWDLLPRARVGRLAWIDPDGRVLVVPVNFGLDGRAVVVRTGDTVLLDAARAGARCAFQADDLEPGLRSGWTVLADGHLRVVVVDAGSAERLGSWSAPGCAYRARTCCCSKRPGSAVASSRRSAASKLSSSTPTSTPDPTRAPVRALRHIGPRPSGSGTTAAGPGSSARPSRHRATW